MATEVDLSKLGFRVGDEFETSHSMENYHSVIANGQEKDRGSFHKGRYRVDAILKEGNHDYVLFTHLDSPDLHQHKMMYGNSIKVLTLISLENGFYGWFWPPDEKGGPWVPDKVFEVRGQVFRDLPEKQTPSDWILERQARTVLQVLSGMELQPEDYDLRYTGRLFKLDAREASDAAKEINRDTTQVIGDYLFFDARYPGPGDYSEEGVIREMDVVYSRLMDIVTVEGAPHYVIQLLGKQPEFNSWLLDDVMSPIVNGRVVFGRSVFMIGDLQLGAYYALPAIEGYDQSRSAAASHVEELRKTKGWEHFEELKQGTLF